MVRVVGLEPTLLSEPDFESGASTSFTTPARAVGKAAQSSGGRAGVNDVFYSPAERRTLVRFAILPELALKAPLLARCGAVLAGLETARREGRSECDPHGAELGAGRGVLGDPRP